MSTKVESPPSAGGMLGRRFVIATVVVLAIGAFAVTGRSEVPLGRGMIR